MATLEVCVDNVESVVTASVAGVSRLELCSALGLEGLTPSPAMVSFAKQHSTCELHAMIRPRSGGFVYAYDEVMQMKEEISLLANAGVDGIVMGLLTQDNNIDESNSRLLMEHAKACELNVTCHRAIDQVVDYSQGIQVLIELGFDRVLTSGHNRSVDEGEKALKYIQARYGDDIQIMAGGGIRADNVRHIIEATGVQHVHCAASLWKQSGTCESEYTSFTEEVLSYQTTDIHKLMDIIKRMQ